MNVGAYIQRIDFVISRLETVPDKIEAVVHKEQDTLLSLNKDQMLLGRNTDGNPFTPSYLDDTYFKTPEAAMDYAQMKYDLEFTHRMRIEHPINYPDKDKNTPNLIVTGPFQDMMYIEAKQDSFLISSTYDDSPDIERKYDRKVFGLAPLSKEYFYRYYLLMALKKHIYGM